MSEFYMESWREDAARATLGDEQFEAGVAEGWIKFIGSTNDSAGEKVELVSCRTPGYGSTTGHALQNRGMIRGVSQH